MTRTKAAGKCRRCKRAANNPFLDEQKRLVYLCDACAEDAIREHNKKEVTQQNER